MTTNFKNKGKEASENIITSDLQLVVFKINDEEFGVNINDVKEIIRWTDLTQIPNAEAHIKGVINLRGSIVVINDLAMKLGLPSKQIDDETRILVIDVDGITVGMIVDSATEVLRLKKEQVRNTPNIISNNIDKNYVEGIGVLNEYRLLTLLNVSKVLGNDNQDHMKNIHQKAQTFLEGNKEKPP